MRASTFLFTLFLRVLVYFLQPLFLRVFSTFETFLNLLYDLVIALHISVRYIERFSCSSAHGQTKES